MPKLSIVCTYYQREKQLLKTLESFRQYNYDFDVVIVDDNSPDDIQLPELPFEVTIIKLREKNWINPAPTFNLGFEYALKSNPDIIIIQNAECYHVGDVVGYALKHVTEINYISFACYSLGKGEGVDLKKLNKYPATGNGDSAWYNHSRYRPLALHFCNAISTSNLRKLNGFDERFAMGLGYEDDFLVYQVKLLGLKIQIVDNPFVFHQYHYDVKAFDFDQALYNSTSALCQELKRERKYKAEHTITPDL
jgi:GT2 family glycosyltransferase